LLHDLEHYIYHAGYGPTNETMGRFIRQLFSQVDHQQIPQKRGHTVKLNRPVRSPKF
jgi:hypothetical protein